MNIQKHKQSKSRRLQKTTLSWVTMVVGFLLGCRVFAANVHAGTESLNISKAEQQESELYGDTSDLNDTNDHQEPTYVVVKSIAFVQDGKINPILKRNLYTGRNVTPPNFGEYSFIQIQNLIIYPGDVHSEQGAMFTAHVLYAKVQNPSQLIDIPVQGFAKVRGPAYLTAADMNSRTLRFKLELSQLKHSNLIQEIAGTQSASEPQLKPDLAETVIGAVLQDYYFPVQQR